MSRRPCEKHADDMISVVAVVTRVLLSCWRYKPSCLITVRAAVADVAISNQSLFVFPLKSICCCCCCCGWMVMSDVIRLCLSDGFNRRLMLVRRRRMRRPTSTYVSVSGADQRPAVAPVSVDISLPATRTFSTWRASNLFVLFLSHLTTQRLYESWLADRHLWPSKL